MISKLKDCTKYPSYLFPFFSKCQCSEDYQNFRCLHIYNYLKRLFFSYSVPLPLNIVKLFSNHVTFNKLIYTEEDSIIRVLLDFESKIESMEDASNLPGKGAIESLKNMSYENNPTNRFIDNLLVEEQKYCSVFSKSLIRGIICLDAQERENGLIKLTDYAIEFLEEKYISAPQGTDCEDKLILMLFRIFHKFLEDPCDLIFQRIFECLKRLFASIIIKSQDNLRILQAGFYSFLKRLVRFAGGNLLSTTSSVWKMHNVISRKMDQFNLLQILDNDFRANLSHKIICELVLGQAGPFKLHRQSICSDQQFNFGSIPYLARFILTSSHFHQTHLIGRITILISLMKIESNCQEFFSDKQLISSLIFARHNIYKKFEFDEKSMLKNFPSNIDWSFIKQVYLKVNTHVQTLSQELFLRASRRLLVYTQCTANRQYSLTNIITIVESEINQLDPDLRSRYEKELSTYLDLKYSSISETSQRNDKENQIEAEIPYQLLPDHEPAYDQVALTAMLESSKEEIREKMEGITLSENDHKYAQVLNLESDVDFQEAEITYLKNSLLSSGKDKHSRILSNIPWISKGLSEKFNNYKEKRDWCKGSVLGNGAYGVCYKARDVRTGVFMAVKRINIKNMAFKINSKPKGPLETDETKMLIEAEIEIMRRLDHKNILPLFGACYNEEESCVDIFMEWMAGGSVSSMLQQFGPCNEVQTIMYTMQIISGIKCLHENGIIHRDLKGANLLIDETGHLLRISDFGTHAILPNMESVEGQLKGQMFGTIPFMAPEVLKSKPYGRACDIWSIGCCIIEMLTSKPPWTAKNITNNMALAFHIQKNNYTPPKPDNLSENLGLLLDSCLQVNPSQRPLAKDLLEFQVFEKFQS